MKPQSMPKVDDGLVGKLLDICEKYSLEEGGTELRWSQGKVILVSNGSRIFKIGSRTACYKKSETIMMYMDANPERNDVSTTYALHLMTSKWNPKEYHME